MIDLIFCNGCLLFKKPEEFYKKSIGRGGFRNPCRKCFTVQVRMWRKDHLEQHNKTNREFQRKYRAKYPEKFKKYKRKYYVANMEKCKDRVFLKRSGITKKQKQEALEAQGFKCAVCGSDSPMNPNGWHADHNHTTGKFRAVLCHPCNLTLGNAKESKERLLALIQYIEIHNDSIPIDNLDVVEEFAW